ncbi:hypothetical protein GCM10010358_45240 [Streptomyces minutiscleroticus]|uniref:POLO box domain-containing protein n=1 Tax=Streptomyces minutiscleroticus TaxID=68238 RepID=A0A918NPX3_9ACTN|nr:AAWKG family protein [Streptomyces minutiscleroticus]GGX86053.1 hypothetical protein GCM10010358_45240 [Streptomyces minutiscleroticus]
MADRYDPKSGENLDKFDNAKAPSSDTWATLVTHITGYPVPDRSTVFDTLRSDHGGKLFRMDIRTLSLSLVVKDSGFLQNKGEDYDIYFFDSGKKTSIKQARIVFEGRVKTDDGQIIFDGTDSTDVNNVSVREGNEFTDYNKDKMSTIPLARYMNGPRAALMALLAGNTSDARFSNLSTSGDGAVDLNSFNTTGDSFDYAAKFFRDHATVLKDWEDRFGRDDASWKGEAAEVFRSLLTKIRENYDAYIETFDTSLGTGAEAGTGNTVYSRALSLGRKYLEDSARTLLNAWLEWAKSPYYDPHRVLRYVLDDLAQWVDSNNVAKTDIKSTTTGSGYSYTTTISHSPQAGFSQVHPEYGDLNDIANWAKVGDKAVKIWTQGVDEYLGKPAAQVQSNLNNNFLDLGDDFTDNVPKPKSTSTASEAYEKKKAEEEEEELKNQREEDKKYQDELREEQRKQREEDKKYQDELREEQNKQREEDKKYQDELRAEQNKQREEDKKYQDELREEQNKQREEDKKYQDELRAEQEKEAEEQRKAMEESLGDINNPGGGANEETLGNLDELLNQKVPVTESLGDLGGVNGAANGGPDGTGDDVNRAVTETLGGLGDVNGAANGGPDGTGDGQQSLTDTPPAVQSLGSLGALNAANDAVTQNLGGLGGLNGGPLRTPTGGSTQFNNGKLNTDFGNGSSTSFDPDTGLLTTVNPDGSTTTTDLGNGMTVTNPDGSITSLGDDGKLTTTFPDGTTQQIDPATGQAVTTNPDGTTTTTDLGSLGNLNGSLGNGSLGGIDGVLDTPTGGSTQLTSGGDLNTDFADGSSSRFDPDTGTLTTVGPDGTTTVTDLGNGATVTNPDGSTTSLGDDGKLVTEFPDGTTQQIDPATGQVTTTNPDGTTTTENLGSFSGLNGGDGVLDTPTGGSTQLTSGGDLTTDFADGGSSRFDPDTGTLTTVGPDGTTTVTDLGNGATVTNPDGSTTSLGDDGKLVTEFPDGTTQQIDPATGQVTTTNPDGTTTTENLGSLGNLNSMNSLGNAGPDMSLESIGDLGDLGNINSDLGDLGNINSDPGGLETPTGGHTSLVGDDFATTFADGSNTRFDPDTGMLTSTDPNNSTTVTDLTHGARVTNPDGSTTFLDNGMLTTEFPDGSKQVIDPDTGIATVTDAQGNTATVDLHDLNTSGGLDSSDVLGGLDDLGSIGGLNGSGGAGGGTTQDVPFSELGLGGGSASTAASGGGLSGTGSLDGYSGSGVAPLSDSTAAAAPLAAAAAAGTPGAPGMPGSPGMPMGGGMGGMGAGAGEKGNGERVRAVLVDAAEESERRNRRRRSPWNRQEDTDTFLAPASRVATTGGESSGEEEAEPGRRVTTSADYLEEDADVWGTDEGGAPAVIGR